jgi:hypothetical protein
VGLERGIDSSANPMVSQSGGADSGALCAGSKLSDGRVNDDLAAALALIADLPLTKDEKADAVRRLLGGGKR